MLYVRNSPTLRSKANGGLYRKYKVKQEWGPNTSKNGLFVQSGLIQRLRGERGELQHGILFTNKHGLVCKEPPDSLRSRSIQAKHLGTVTGDLIALTQS